VCATVSALETILFKEPEFMLLTTDITLERILRLIFPRFCQLLSLCIELKESSMDLQRCSCANIVRNFPFLTLNGGGWEEEGRGLANLIHNLHFGRSKLKNHVQSRLTIFPS
jgi:hypothetical protein